VQPQEVKVSHAPRRSTYQGVDWFGRAMYEVAQAVRALDPEHRIYVYAGADADPCNLEAQCAMTVVGLLQHFRWSA
jgi:hypothetical protein